MGSVPRVVSAESVCADEEREDEFRDEREACPVWLVGAV